MTVWQSVPGDDGILVAVVVELVVAGQSQQGAKARTQREEDLSGRSNPDLTGIFFKEYLFPIRPCPGLDRFLLV